MIFSGDELLRGDIVNTNQSYLGEQLLSLGLFATHALTVFDDRQALADAIRAALGRRPRILVLSGGLGPTEDDLTREAVSDALGLPLEFHEELMAKIAAQFQSLGAHMGENNRKQAFVPQGSTPIPMVGTAPGFWLEHQNTFVAALPGVPHELKRMWEDTLFPLLKSHLVTSRSASRLGVIVRRLRVYGIGESLLAEALEELPWRGEGVTIGTRAGFEGITLILRADPSPEARERLNQLESRAREILGDKVYGVDDDDMAAVVGRILSQRGLTAVTAESCTGGLVAKRFTDIPGSSSYFLGGVVSYSNRLKEELLGVHKSLLEQHGAVSEPVAAAMAKGARERLGGDCSISVTGIAGPSGGTEEKPVGLVFIGTDVKGAIEVSRFRMFRGRDEIRQRTAQAALDCLRRRLLASAV